ncbi:putative F-box protein [Cardamine amara subsp. amara]|uniref:F-box protein n=1 Tax=Cardamine amara subsp. amara TaxID=228776 RepID=A0ABD1AAF9_CARAN
MEEKKIDEKGKTTSSSSSSKRGRRRSEEAGDDTSWKRIEREREVNEIANNDVLEEIMVRLPVKSLLKFQTVSKHWKHTIKSSRFFRERHMLHNKTLEPKFLNFYEDRSLDRSNTVLTTMRLEWSSTCLVEEEDYYTSYERGERNVLVSESVDGLFCIYNCDFTRPIIVINPAMRWSQTLPLAKVQLEHSSDSNKKKLPYLGFGKDYVTGMYKLVWLQSINDNNTLTACEVFDFGSKQWRQVIPPPHGHQTIYKRGSTFANGWLYWASRDKTKFVAFDLHMEMFRVVENPIFTNEASSLSSVYSMDSIDDDRPLVWISEIKGDGMQQVWRVTNQNRGGALLKIDKIFSLDLNKINSTWFESPRSSISSLYPVAISKNGDKVIFSSDAKHDSQNLLLFQSLNRTSIHNGIFSYSSSRPSTDSCLIPYFPSLVSPF